jgi:hypothetical protein
MTRLAALAAVCTAQEVRAAGQPPAIPEQLPVVTRVRSEDPALSALVSEASRRSISFRRLVTAIEATDGLVYVESGHCSHDGLACLPLSVTLAGPYRLLHIVIDRRSQNDEEVMASIGHELQHAIELLGERRIKSGAAIYHFYRGSGRGYMIGDAFETNAAIAAGDAVRTEVNKNRTCASPPGR